MQAPRGRLRHLRCTHRSHDEGACRSPRPRARSWCWGSMMQTGQAVLAESLNSPTKFRARPICPRTVTRRSEVASVSKAPDGVAALRIEGPEPSTAYRAQELMDLLSPSGRTESLGGRHGTPLARAAGRFVLTEPRERFMWRISVTPSQGPGVAADIAPAHQRRILFRLGRRVDMGRSRRKQADAGAEAVRTRSQRMAEDTERCCVLRRACAPPFPCSSRCPALSRPCPRA